MGEPARQRTKRLAAWSEWGRTELCDSAPRERNAAKARGSKDATKIASMHQGTMR